MSRRSWRNYIQGRGAAPDSTKVNAIIRDWIEVYLKETDDTTNKLQDMHSTESDNSVRSKMNMLMRRWEQIKQLCNGALIKLD